MTHTIQDKDKRIIVDVPAVSQITLWANQGFDYLLSRFPQNNQLDNKWDSLYATRQVVLLANDIGRVIPNYIVEQIERYLLAHNQDGETFDKVDRATYAAAEICEALGLNQYFKKPSGVLNEVTPTITNANVVTSTMFDLAQYVLLADKIEKLREIYQITARFISERDFEKASWEDDIMTTASVLRALVRIDGCSEINTSVTNIVCSCYQDSDCVKLTSLLVDSIERSRQSEYDIRLNYEKKQLNHQQECKQNANTIASKDAEIILLQKAIDENTRIISEYEELNNSIKNLNSRLSAWLISIVGLLIFAVVLFCSFLIFAKNVDQTNYIHAVNDFFISWGIGGSIIDVLAIVVTIKLFKVLYYKNTKEETSETQQNEDGI